MKGRISKFTVFCLAVSITLGIVLAVPALAVQPDNEIIVSKDKDGQYSTITAALASITDASDANRYRITVKPGIYNGSITMKPFVDVVGSGTENTKITSSANTKTTATVIGSDDSRLENIWIDNSGATSGRVIGILNFEVSMIMNKIKVTVDTTSNADAPAIRNDGNCYSDYCEKNVITNCELIVNARNAYGVELMNGGDVLVRGCNIKTTNNSTASGMTAGILSWYSGIDYMNRITVRDSVVISEGSNYNYAIFGMTVGDIIVSDTRLEAIGTANTKENAAVYAENLTINITDSDLSVSGTGSSFNCAVAAPHKDASVIIAGSTIKGALCNTSNLKVVNSRDENSDPIADIK